MKLNILATLAAISNAEEAGVIDGYVDDIKCNRLSWGY